MGDGATTAAGTQLYIGTTASNAQTDTYTAVAEVTNIPEFGRVYNTIKYNPLATRGTKKFKGSYDDGSLAVDLGKDLSDPGQAACLAARDTDFDYNFKIVANDAIAPQSAVVTITDATPGVVTLAAHGFLAGVEIELTSTGTLPAGLSTATPYYVVDPTTNTFELAATPGGSAITTTSAGSGVHTATTVPAPTTQIFKAKVMSFTTNFGTVDNVTAAKMTIEISSGSIAETARLP